MLGPAAMLGAPCRVDGGNASAYNFRHSRVQYNETHPTKVLAVQPSILLVFVYISAQLIDLCLE